eukprot:CAMPEP_0114238456 /NCGR_PEP_ID=MMETSP0058-20121206/7934_1 /TAXON_ID=36894 /ORGANISM="Pyramimonas parkeae, CCMP726" /LENGTH=582 /DNA_ID=CAMNT_0001350567 /DNA_START=31 /DNA_END=1779 /DNA_ORIENTATION=+
MRSSTPVHVAPARRDVNGLMRPAANVLMRAPRSIRVQGRKLLQIRAVATTPIIANPADDDVNEGRQWVSTQLRNNTWSSVKSKKNVVRKTKVVCTIGPSSWDRESLFALADAGMNVARLNMSHGDHESHQKVIDLVKEYNSSGRGDTKIGLLLDTKGPEVRSGDLPTPIELSAGDTFTFTIDLTRPLGPFETHVNYDNFVKDVKVKDILLVDGGMQSMQVKSVTDKDVVCVVLEGGTFKSRRHLNVRGTTADLPSITDKDWSDLKFGVENGVDFYALSFVHDAKTIETVKKFLSDHGDDKALVLPKIESVNAVKNLDEIITASDGAMVARGDLGAELPEVEVPLIQSEIVTKCSQQGKPVIVATNMLESMIDNPCPTRAEVADITIAVREGADCVMLSGETANGKYPVKALQTMATVAQRVPWELTQAPLTPFGAPAHMIEQKEVRKGLLDQNSILTEMFAYNAVSMANLQKVPIVVFSQSGYSGQLLSHFRPRSAVFVFTNDLRVAQRMSIYRGITAIPLAEKCDAADPNRIYDVCINHLVAQGRVKAGSQVCIVKAVQDHLITSVEGSLSVSFRTVKITG